MTSRLTSNISTPNTSKITRSSKGGSKTSTMRTEKINTFDVESPKKEKIDPNVISKRELQEKEYEEEVRKKKIKRTIRRKKVS